MTLPAQVTSALGRRTLPAHWPLTVLFLGFPLWWALGLRTILPMLLVVPVLAQLARRRVVRIPPGFGIWLLFVAWVAIGLLVLWAEAPGAVPGGGGSRVLVFGYRLAWYFTVTVFLLWVLNTPERDLPSRHIHKLLAFMFLVTAAGGLLGVFAPNFEFSSLVELGLPRGVRGNSLIQSMVHPASADVQHVLGYFQARPRAPFAFANSWGSNLALYLPFFVAAVFTIGGKRRRAVRLTAAAVALILAAIPVVYSLNRGLWACLGLGAVGLGILILRRGRLGAIAAAAVLSVVAFFVFVASPLGTIYQERLEHQHSNDRRSQLLVETVTSTASGSPIIGFGSTRDVQGSFASIAGASTPDCPACGVPPLGTQGFLWFVIFAHGFVGMVLFLAFFAIALSRCWRCRTTNETLCTFVLAFFFLQLLIYDTLGEPLLTVMIAIACVFREQAASPHGGGKPQPTLNRLVREVRRGLPMMVVLMVLGGLVGVVLASRQPVRYVATAEVQLRPYPTSLAESVLREPTPVRESTVDTEAAILVSEAVLGKVVGRSGYDSVESLRDSIRVTAPPNTSMLDVQLRGSNPDDVRSTLRQVAESYLVQRRTYLTQRREQVLALLREKQRQLEAIEATTLPVVRRDSTVLTRSYESRLEAQQRIESTIVSVVLTPTSAGEVMRVGPAKTVPPAYDVPVASGVAIGLAVAAAVVGLLPEQSSNRQRRNRRKATWTPARARGRGGKR